MRKVRLLKIKDFLDPLEKCNPAGSGFPLVVSRLVLHVINSAERESSDLLGDTDSEVRRMDTPGQELRSAQVETFRLSNLFACYFSDMLKFLAYIYPPS